jgi:LmbE family N-acetylglucosaminyl deacetylase
MLLTRILNKLNRTARSLRYGIPQCVYSKEWKIKSQDKFLVLSPHPDDESIGCGGFLLKYGPQCDVVLLTDGRHGDPDMEPVEVAEIRKREFETVMEKLQINHYQCLDIEDGRLIENFDIFKRILLNGYDYIFMPSPTDNHPDHLAVSRMFYKLASLLRITCLKVVYYEIWSALSLPSHYIDISDVADKKRDLINKYQSQVKFIDYASRILALNQYRGIYHHIDYAECFEII